jgi:hypothetical protein
MWDLTHDPPTSAGNAVARSFCSHDLNWRLEPGMVTTFNFQVSKQHLKRNQTYRTALQAWPKFCLMINALELWLVRAPPMVELLLMSC